MPRSSRHGPTARQLNATERDFLNASLDESAPTQRTQLKTNRRLCRALSVAAGLLVSAIALLVFALISRHQAVGADATADPRRWRRPRRVSSPVIPSARY